MWVCGCLLGVVSEIQSQSEAQVLEAPVFVWVEVWASHCLKLMWMKTNLLRNSCVPEVPRGVILTFSMRWDHSFLSFPSLKKRWLKSYFNLETCLMLRTFFFMWSSINLTQSFGANMLFCLFFQGEGSMNDPWMCLWAYFTVHFWLGERRQPSTWEVSKHFYVTFYYKNFQTY